MGWDFTRFYDLLKDRGYMIYPASLPHACRYKRGCVSTCLVAEHARLVPATWLRLPRLPSSKRRCLSCFVPRPPRSSVQTFPLLAGLVRLCGMLVRQNFEFGPGGSRVLASRAQTIATSL